MLIDLLKNDSWDVLKNVDAKDFENKSIMITGASGLIGIHLISILKSLKFDFDCILLINSDPAEFFVDLISHDKRFTFYQCDLTLYTNLVNIEEFDYIFHLATYGQPTKFMKEKIKTIQLNTEVTIKILKRLKKDGKFLFLSTSEVYSGLSGLHKENEIGTTNTDHFRSCYIEAKRCGEAICNIYKEQGFDIKVIRLCLGYGTGVKINDDRALNKFIIEALQKNEIQLLDDGSAIRKYCYISDVLEMMLNIFFYGKEFIYNVGGIETTTIKELADKIGSRLNCPVGITENTSTISNVGAPVSVGLDLSRYLNEFKKEKFVTLDDGLNRTINWWKILLD